MLTEHTPPRWARKPEEMSRWWMPDLEPILETRRSSLRRRVEKDIMVKDQKLKKVVRETVVYLYLIKKYSIKLINNFIF